MLSIPQHLRTVADSDGAAILDISSNQITPLNSMGSFIWDRLREGHAVSDIIQQIATASNTGVSTVEREVSEFVEELKKYFGVIRKSSDKS